MFNEYFEFFVKDLNRQRIDISVKGTPHSHGFAPTLNLDEKLNFV